MRGAPQAKSTPDGQAASIVIGSIYCAECAPHNRDQAEIILESVHTKGAGWKATGKVICPNCGAAHNSIRKKIPIVATDFKCPKCKNKTKLEYNVTKIKQADPLKPDVFEFHVDIICGKMSHKFSLKKIIDSVLEVLSIGVGPEGVKTQERINLKFRGPAVLALGAHGRNNGCLLGMRPPPYCGRIAKLLAMLFTNGAERPGKGQYFWATRFL
jgi:DNA-directed RNA polymerase subunit M/transcription elongation factor TFIIS